jgi:molybdopterin converting factor small subunit
LKVLFYGRLADLIGHELEMDVEPDCSIVQLRERLISDHPDIEDALMNKRVRACVAGTLVDNNFRISATDRVEFLAPVSGG